MPCTGFRALFVDFILALCTPSCYSHRYPAPPASGLWTFWPTVSNRCRPAPTCLPPSPLTPLSSTRLSSILMHSLYTNAYIPSHSSIRLVKVLMTPRPQGHWWAGLKEHCVTAGSMGYRKQPGAQGQQDGWDGHGLSETPILTFLGPTIISDLKWETRFSNVIKWAHQRMFFLRLRWKMKMKEVHTEFYRATNQSVPHQTQTGAHCANSKPSHRPGTGACECSAWCQIQKPG